jgi:hypothetical protein
MPMGFVGPLAIGKCRGRPAVPIISDPPIMAGGGPIIMPLRAGGILPLETGGLSGNPIPIPHAGPSMGPKFGNSGPPNAGPGPPG